MIRTTLSCLILFACLLFVTKLLEPTSAEEHRTSARRNAASLRRTSLDRDDSVVASEPVPVRSPSAKERTADSSPDTREVEASDSSDAQESACATADETTPREPPTTSESEAIRDEPAEESRTEEAPDAQFSVRLISPERRTTVGRETRAAEENIPDDAGSSFEPRAPEGVPLESRPAGSTASEIETETETEASITPDSDEAGSADEPAASSQAGAANSGDSLPPTAATPAEDTAVETPQTPVTESQDDEEASEQDAARQQLPPIVPAPPKVTIPLTRDMQIRRDKLRRVLESYSHRRESAETRSPWGILHAVIGFGAGTQINVGGRPVNAIGWLAWNGPGRDQRIFYTEKGELRTRLGPGVQGHDGQFLAVVAQMNVSQELELRADGRTFALRDLIAFEQATCRDGAELTFKLIGLSHYLDSDATWENNIGQHWDIPRLIREELKQPINGAACGGTHRLMGFSYSVRRRQAEGKPIDGQWLRAKKYTDAYHVYTMKLQNPDGSFSTNWFERRGNEPNMERKLQTTGHMLEWLCFSLPDDEVRGPRLAKTADFLIDAMLKTSPSKWEVGPLGHACRSLRLYHERVYGEPYQASGVVALQKAPPRKR